MPGSSSSSAAEGGVQLTMAGSLEDFDAAKVKAITADIARAAAVAAADVKVVSHGLYSYGLYSYGLSSYGLCSYGPI